MTITESVVCNKGVLKPGCRISRGWFKCFMKRQPQLSLHKGDATANVGMDSVNPEAMSKYFDDVLEEYGPKIDPERIAMLTRQGCLWIIAHQG